MVWKAGLWAPHLPTEYGGMGLDFLAHAYMNEVLAYAVGGAALFGVVAPNSGNQTILVKYGTEQQKQDWLLPIIDGKMESGFSMTEPENPGSDPRSLTTSAVLDGDHWVINGHKWFTSNGIDAQFFIVMARVADSDADAKRRQGEMAQFIVPTATKGVNIVRGIGVWGRAESDDCEVIYDNVRIPKENILGQVGQGHQAAQDRLGAGRIFHCMNSVGQMWRAFDLMVERALQREVDGGPLKDKQFIQGFIADSYIDIQSARLMTIHAAEKIDQGLDAARTDISAIKVAYRPPTSGWWTGPSRVGGGRDHQRPAPGRHVHGGQDPAHRRRPRRGTQDPHRQKRDRPLRARPILGLRQLTARRRTGPRSFIGRHTLNLRPTGQGADRGPSVGPNASGAVSRQQARQIVPPRNGRGSLRPRRSVSPGVPFGGG